MRRSRTLLLLVLIGAPDGVAAIVRKVWLLWWQGWDQRVWLPHQVADSYRFFNPGWTVHLLDNTSVAEYAGEHLRPFFEHVNISTQAKSDMLRLALMARWGGFWADASLLCMEPLDGWLPAALAPVGFWSYRDVSPGVRDTGHSEPCSWAMASLPSSYIAKAWNDASLAYWTARLANGERRLDDIYRPFAVEYFWMNRLFTKLVQIDGRFAAEWLQMKSETCRGPKAAATLFTRHGVPIEEQGSLAQQLADSPPHVLKLSVYGFTDWLTPDEVRKAPNTTTMFVVSLVRKQIDAARARHRHTNT